MQRQEGKANVIIEPGVFLNKGQAFNRDFTSMVLQTFGTNLRVLETMGASGIRSIRYCLEADVDWCLCCDIDSESVDVIEKNRDLNGLDPEKLIAVHANAKHLMAHCRAFSYALHQKHEKQLQHIRLIPAEKKQCPNVIDIDPYGSCIEFLDDAVQTVENGGLLCITSTDSATLCGKDPEVAFYKYGGHSVKRGYMHELGLRIAMHAIESAATRYQRSATPMVCFSFDFYVRLFVKIEKGAVKAKTHGINTSMVYQCNQCEAFHVIPLGKIKDKGEVKASGHRLLLYGAGTHPRHVHPTCEICGGAWTIGGPFYSGPLYDTDFVKKCIETSSKLEDKDASSRLVDFLNFVLAEDREVPLFYDVPALFRYTKAGSPKIPRLMGALKGLGFKASQFQRCPQSIKTDAPNTVMYDMVRKWHQEQGGLVAKGGADILAKPIETSGISFATHVSTYGGTRLTVEASGPKSKAKKMKISELL